MDLADLAEPLPCPGEEAMELGQASPDAQPHQRTTQQQQLHCEPEQAQRQQERVDQSPPQQQELRWGDRAAEEESDRALDDRRAEERDDHCAEFQQREGAPNAVARAEREREVREFRTCAAARARK